jgi:hypothetical protein
MVFIYAKFYENTLGMQDKLSILIEKETKQVMINLEK